MMEVLGHLGEGFAVALDPVNLLYCLVGVTLGTLIGMLPGLGPTAGIAILIPITAGLPSVTAIIMLAGIYYGSYYGSSTSAILINTPGMGASVVTALDGYAMARQGRAGPALGMTTIASFVGGSTSIILLMLLAPPLASLAIGFGPPEYFALMFLGLTIIAGVAGKSLAKGLVAGAFGILLATPGLDPITGLARFAYGRADLMGGIDFISVVVGLFAISEVLSNLEGEVLKVYETRVRGIYPSRADWRRSAGALVRGSFLGFFVGILPGASNAVAAFLAYDIERKASKHPDRFGTGVIEGVTAPEAANNAACSGGLVPLLTLGLPANSVLAVLLGALMIHGLRPGPLLFEASPEFVWGLIASMYIGNVMLLILNLPLIPLWVMLIRVPYPVLAPLVLMLSFIGAYGVRNSLFDVWVTMAFGIIGYLMRKLEFPPAPVILGLILGPRIEAALGQSLIMSRGNPAIFFARPMSLVLMLLAVASMIIAGLSRRQVNKIPGTE
jgi:putative tricarboxylic transport membrane protein